MVYYILVGIFFIKFIIPQKDCFPTLLRVVAVFFIARFLQPLFFIAKNILKTHKPCGERRNFCFAEIRRPAFDALFMHAFSISAHIHAQKTAYPKVG